MQQKKDTLHSDNLQCVKLSCIDYNKTEAKVECEHCCAACNHSHAQSWQITPHDTQCFTILLDKTELYSLRSVNLRGDALSSDPISFTDAKLT